MSGMKHRCLVDILVIALALTCACSNSPPPESHATKPTEPIVSAAPVAVPATPKPSACSAYIAAMDRLKACTAVDAWVRDNLVRMYQRDEAVITARPAPASLVEQLCATSSQTVQSVLDSKCGPPLESRSVEALQSELQKTLLALDISKGFVNDENPKLRAEARAKVDELTKEAAKIRALIVKRGA
jgi:hypothetical protein